MPLTTAEIPSRISHSLLASLVLLIATGLAFADDKPVDYRREVLPIFAGRCFQCHGPAKEESKFRLDVKERAYAGGESGQPAIVPGDPEKSQLIRFVRGDCEDKVMPAEGERLSEEQVDLLTRWVKEGAKWEDEKEKRRLAELGGIPGEPDGVSPRVRGATIRAAISGTSTGLSQPEHL
jgi:mono/diheme cytochrome c family protein